MRYRFDGNAVLEEEYEPRYKARLAIYYGTNPQLPMKDYSINMSTGGIFVETSDPLPEDTNLYVQFRLPGLPAPITCKGKVAWINEPGKLKSSCLPSGMGLQFVDLSLDKMRSIRTHICEGLEPEW